MICSILLNFLLPIFTFSTVETYNKDSVKSIPTGYFAVNGGIGYPTGSFIVDGDAPRGSALKGQSLNLFGAIPVNNSHFGIALNFAYNENSFDLNGFCKSQNNKWITYSPCNNNSSKYSLLSASTGLFFNERIKKISFDWKLLFGAAQCSQPAFSYLLTMHPSSPNYYYELHSITANSGIVFSSGIGLDVRFLLSKRFAIILNADYCHYGTGTPFRKQLIVVNSSGSSPDSLHGYYPNARISLLNITAGISFQFNQALKLHFTDSIPKNPSEYITINAGIGFQINVDYASKGIDENVFLGFPIHHSKYGIALKVDYNVTGFDATALSHYLSEEFAQPVGVSSNSYYQLSALVGCFETISKKRFSFNFRELLGVTFLTKPTIVTSSSYITTNPSVPPIISYSTYQTGGYYNSFALSLGTEINFYFSRHIHAMLNTDFIFSYYSILNTSVGLGYQF